MVYTGRFEAPEPGSWEREATHMIRPVSRYIAQIFPAAMMRGFKEMTAHYGMLLSHLEVAVIEGFIYTAPRPVGAPKGAKGPPPKPVFKLLTWFHPEVRRRIRRANVVLASKTWRDEVRSWDEELKPAMLRAHDDLARFDTAAASDDSLAGHLDECQRALDAAIFRHHRLNGAAMVPVGLYLSAVQDWTGLPGTDILGALRGASPESIGGAEELARLGSAIRASDEAGRALASDGLPGEILGKLRALPGEAGKAAREYVDRVGYRIMSGYDVADRYALEVPEVLVGAIRSAVGDRAAATDGGAAALVAKLRDAVPAEHRPAFDELLAEARHAYRIRDERCVLNDAVVMGITRRALLEAGRRLVSRGRLEDAEHAVDLRPEEVTGLLRGADTPAPSSEDLAEYTRYRTSKTYLDAPEHLGSPPSAPPPPEWLPPAAARIQRATVAILGAMFQTRPKHGPGETRATVVKGLAVGGGAYEGKARLVLSPADFPRVEKGDVLVARATGPTYNTLLPLLGALVTDRGGLLSHPAIIAREYGLPGVVGCIDATTRIPDGARVRVDGASGEVHLL